MAHKSEAISICKGIHKGREVIWLKFSNRPDWLESIKRLSVTRYSATQKTWYIAYNKEAWRDFRMTQIPFTQSGTHAEDTNNPGASASSIHDNTSITQQNVGNPVSPSAVEEVTDIHEGIEVSWSGRGFVILMPYKFHLIEKVKQLEGAYWHQKLKRWMAKNTVGNLNKIQEMWQLWTEAELSVWHDRIMMSIHPCKVLIYHSPQYKNQVCVSIQGYVANHAIVKRISHRAYLADKKIYLVPANKVIIDQLIASYEDIGYPIDNRLANYNDQPSEKRKTASSKVTHFVNKMPSKWYSTLKKYTDTMLSQGYSTNTIIDYTGSMCRVLEWCQVDDMEQITISQVNELLQSLANKSLSHSVLNTIHSAVRIFVNKVSERQWEELDRLERPRQSTKLPKILCENEILRILDNINNIKHLAIVSILYGSGIRRGELTNINIDDVYWDRNQIFIRSGKGDKDRVVNLSQMAKELLETYFHEYRPIYYLFEGQVSGTPYSPSSVAAILRRAASKANVSKKVTPHIMRHSFATHSMDAGIAMPKIQALLGHKDVRTTMIYTHLIKDDINKIESPLDRLMKHRKDQNDKKS